MVIGSDSENDYDVFKQNRCLDLPPSERLVAFLSSSLVMIAFLYSSLASKS